MDKKKLAEIKNRTAYIHDLVVELENVIKEVEVAETINTAKEGRKTLNDAPFMAGSVVNELEGYDETTECTDHCLAKYVAGAIVVLTIIYLLAQ